MRIVRPLVFAFGLVAALLGSAVFAQTYPSKPVRLIVTYPPAGSSDLMARILGQKLSELWGQPVLVENKAGAAGSIGMEYAAHQAPDGYSFVIGNLGPTVVNPILSKVPYDVERDFVPLSLIATGPNILVVNPITPATTLGELMAYARANPGKLNFGSGGSGSVAHLSGEMFKSLAHVEIVHVRGQSAANAPDATGRAYRRSQVAFYEKHHPLWLPLLRLYLRLRRIQI